MKYLVPFIVMCYGAIMVVVIQLYIKEYFKIISIINKRDYKGWFIEIYQGSIINNTKSALPIFFTPSNFGLIKSNIADRNNSKYKAHIKKHDRYVKIFWSLFLIPIIYACYIEFYIKLV